MSAPNVPENPPPPYAKFGVKPGTYATEKAESAAQMEHQGGLARAKSLTSHQRTVIARGAAIARWMGGK